MNQRTILAFKFSWNPATVRVACTEIHPDRRGTGQGREAAPPQQAKSGHWDASAELNSTQQRSACIFHTNSSDFSSAFRLFSFMFPEIIIYTSNCLIFFPWEYQSPLGWARGTRGGQAPWQCWGSCVTNLFIQWICPKSCYLHRLFYLCNLYYGTCFIIIIIGYLRFGEIALMSMEQAVTKTSKMKWMCARNWFCSS